MDISHLYDDSFFGSPTIALDIKERMRTKEINAREDRNFERWTKIFQRGKEICEKNTAWEKWKVGQALRTIWERTPGLERSLAAEKARVESLQKTLLARAHPKNVDTLTARDISPHISPISPQIVSAEKHGSQTRNRRRHWKKHKQKERQLNTDLTLHRHEQADFVSRSEHVIRSLARLSWQRERRRQDHEQFKKELMKLSKPVIYRARVVLRGNPNFDSNHYLDELEHYLRHGDNSNVSGDHSNVPSTTGTINEDNNHLVFGSNELQFENAPELDRLLPPVFVTMNTYPLAHKSDVLHIDYRSKEMTNTSIGLKDENVFDGNSKHDLKVMPDVKTVKVLQHAKRRTASVFTRQAVNAPLKDSYANECITLPAIRATETIIHKIPVETQDMNSDTYRTHINSCFDRTDRKSVLGREDRNNAHGSVSANSNNTHGSVSANSNNTHGSVSANSNNTHGSVSANSNNTHGSVSANSNNTHGSVSANSNNAFDNTDSNKSYSGHLASRSSNMHVISSKGKNVFIGTTITSNDKNRDTSTSRDITDNTNSKDASSINDVASNNNSTCASTSRDILNNSKRINTSTSSDVANSIRSVYTSTSRDSVSSSKSRNTSISRDIGNSSNSRNTSISRDVGINNKVKDTSISRGVDSNSKSRDTSTSSSTALSNIDTFSINSNSTIKSSIESDNNSTFISSKEIDLLRYIKSIGANNQTDKGTAIISNSTDFNANNNSNNRDSYLNKSMNSLTNGSISNTLNSRKAVKNKDKPNKNNALQSSDTNSKSNSGSTSNISDNINTNRTRNTNNTHNNKRSKANFVNTFNTADNNKTINADDNTKSNNTEDNSEVSHTANNIKVNNIGDSSRLNNKHNNSKQTNTVDYRSSTNTANNNVNHPQVNNNMNSLANNINTKHTFNNINTNSLVRCDISSEGMASKTLNIRKGYRLGKLVFLPSASVSQVILEEDEATSTSPVQPRRTSSQSRQLSRARQ